MMIDTEAGIKGHDILQALDGPELIFGLVGPVGTDLDNICNALIAELSKYNYKIKIIRVSEQLYNIDKYSSMANIKYSSESERIKEHMTAGSGLREETKRGDIFTLLCVSAIRRYREKINEKNKDIPESDREDSPLNKTAYILRSLKHPDEITTLRAIYGRAVSIISAYSPREKRIEALAEKISRSKFDSYESKYRTEAEDLISIDEEEKGRELGQNVTEAFPRADLFVDVRSKDKTDVEIRRFIQLLFGHPYHTPTRDEFGMFHAKSAALRSADLARQVGAAITNKEGDIISVGCNDVPKYGGGLYWAGDNRDNRDYTKGFDSSVKFKRDILAEVLDRFQKADWLSEKNQNKDIETLLTDLLDGKDRKLMKGAQIMNLLEFGRSVHAEMAALSDAVKRGINVKNAVLFCTTFPCHLCARHIIAAGIDRVVYIEPYPKSKVKKLYSDEIIVDEEFDVNDRISFEPFVGIAPRQYMTLFEMRGDRKKRNGDIIEWEENTAKPKLKRYVLSYIMIEKQVLGYLIPHIFEDLPIGIVQ